MQKIPIYKLTNPPNDSISDLQLNSNYLIGATSWDGSFNLWQAKEDFSEAQHLLEVFTSNKAKRNAFLRLCFDQMNNQIFLGNSKGKISLLTPNNSILTEIGSHFGIISGLKWSDQNALISTGSDEFIKIWDIRSQEKLTFEMSLDQKPVNIDVQDYFVYIGCNSGEILKLDLRKSETFQKISVDLGHAPLTSIVSIPQNDGFFAGFINGYSIFSLNNTVKYYQCHRKADVAYSVNCVSLFQDIQKGISGGGNGSLTIYDFENQIIKDEIQISDSPITNCVCWKNGIAIYATGYDWKQGIEYYKVNKPEISINVADLSKK